MNEQNFKIAKQEKVCKTGEVGKNKGGVLS